MPVYCGIILGILDENGISYGSDLIKTVTPLGIRGTAEYFIRQLGVNSTVQELMSLMNERAIHEYTYRIPAKSHVVEVLKELKRGGADLNVLTASPHATLDPCLKRLGIYDLFTNVWSCDDFGTTKADPEIYKRAAEKMGRSVEDVIFLDDNCHADQTAKAAGMTVYGVYDESSKEFADEIKAVADAYLYDFKELLEL